MKITLAAARVNRGLTQKELAQMLGISNKTLCSWEKGKSYPSVIQLQLLEKILGISYENLDFVPGFSLKAKN